MLTRLLNRVAGRPQPAPPPIIDDPMYRDDDSYLADTARLEACSHLGREVGELEPAAQHLGHVAWGSPEHLEICARLGGNDLDRTMEGN